MNFLVENGYNVLSIPRDDIEPLSVITAPNGAPTLLGPLPEMMAPGSDPPPDPKEGAPTINIVGKNTAAIEAKGGFSILNGVLEFFGFQAPPEVRAAYEKAENFSFYFDSVKRRSVSAVDLNNYLDRTMPGELKYISEMLDQKGEAVLISETLASNRFGVVAEGTGGAEVNAALKLARIAEGKIGVKIDESTENMVWYEGNVDLTFAFKGYLIWLNTNINPRKFQLTFMKRISPFRSAKQDNEPQVIRAARENHLVYKPNGLLSIKSRP